MREHAGRTAREAAGLISTDQAKISHIEAGRIGVSEDRIRRLATFYACGDSALVDALCTIAREHRGQHWWDEYRGVLAPGFLDIAELEHHARYMRCLQSVTLPGWCRHRSTPAHCSPECSPPCRTTKSRRVSNTG
ncbi:helix-turn-helix transcriptional regulator [Streptomyces sp. M10(2022)]